ncbi:hypothetical protein MLD38_006464 [Melastoma candidum]|uniref:Uncharacterized protein n=1 Tax=Melastoma candidum TaxID=119954 RepID=A0ACB9RM85_9MYRT|nr:hypothetical protein MLD38_006464 [Melastoma candidum]
MWSASTRGWTSSACPLCRFTVPEDILIPGRDVIVPISNDDQEDDSSGFASAPASASASTFVAVGGGTRRVSGKHSNSGEKARAFGDSIRSIIAFGGHRRPWSIVRILPFLPIHPFRIVQRGLEAGADLGAKARAVLPERAEGVRHSSLARAAGERAAEEDDEHGGGEAVGGVWSLIKTKQHGPASQQHAKSLLWNPLDCAGSRDGGAFLMKQLALSNQFACERTRRLILKTRLLTQITVTDNEMKKLWKVLFY